MYGELRFIYVISVYERCVGAADSVEGVVSTDAVLVKSVGRGNDESLKSLVVGVVLCGSLGYESYASLTLGCLTGSTLIGADVGLGLALVEVESVTKKGGAVLAENLLNVNVGSLICLVGGCKVVILICNVACEVESLTEICLEENKLERLICLYLICNNGNVKIRGRSKDLDLVILFNVSFSTLAASLKSKGYGGGLFGKSYGKLAAIDSDKLAVSAPSKLNLGICSACGGKGDLACLLDALRNFKLGDSEVDLLCGSSLNLLEELEGSCGNGADVDSVAVYVNNTGNVCKIISLCKVICEYLCLLLSVHNANAKVGGVNSYVGLAAVFHLEVEILRAISKILSADNNALDGYKRAKSIKKSGCLRISVRLEQLGDIVRSKSGDGFVKNSNDTLFDLVSCAVNLLDTGNAYLHTNLKS